MIDHVDSAVRYFADSKTQLYVYDASIESRKVISRSLSSQVWHMRHSALIRGNASEIRKSIDAIISTC